MFVGSREPTADHVARHAAYVADLVGVRHAGIGLDISFRQDGVDDTPPGDFDPGYWWPRAAGYDRALSRSTYPPVGAWRVLRPALERTGMTGDEAALVMGGNMHAGRQPGVAPVARSGVDERRPVNGILAAPLPAGLRGCGRGTQGSLIRPGPLRPATAPAFRQPPTGREPP